MGGFDDIFNTQSTGNHSFAPFDKEAWAAQKQQAREDAYALIDATAMELAGNGEIFQCYLDVQSQFDRYTVNNAILITAQLPEATRLKDFDGWKKSGVYVRKGETGITILEPGKEYEREDGSIGVSYDAKKVFDISQTNSRQRATPAVVRDERLMLKALINNAPCQLSITSEMPENMGALYKPEEKTIFIRQGMDAPTIFRCLSQELAHAHMDNGDYSRAECAFPAYCASYMLCKRNGIETEAFRFDRAPEVMGGLDSQGIRAELGVIRDVANTISADMNRVFDAQQRAAEKQRDAGAR